MLWLNKNAEFYKIKVYLKTLMMFFMKGRHTMKRYQIDNGEQILCDQIRKEPLRYQQWSLNCMTM